jgi:CRISPR system Cascade subunit CasE
MYLSRLTLNHSRAAYQWLSNPYRVHQRLKMACESDPRFLFRVENHDGLTQILVQSHIQPRWELAFADLRVLAASPETKPFELSLGEGGRYRFRLLANPTARKTVLGENNNKVKLRVGLHREEEQRQWLARKLEEAGAELLGCLVTQRGIQRSHKAGDNQEGEQAHLAVLYEGILSVIDSDLFVHAVDAGFGSAKGYGFGLLSLAPV